MAGRHTLRILFVSLGLASFVVCDFGPITAVEVRALGSLAYGLSMSRECSPAPQRRSLEHPQESREIPSSTAQTACWTPSSGLRGGDGVPAFVTPPTSPPSSPRRCLSAQEFPRHPLEASAKGLQHRAVLLRRVQSGLESRTLPRGSSVVASAANTAVISSGLLRTQGAFHHLKVIASAAKNTPFYRGSRTVKMTAVPGGDIPADSSLEYPAANSQDLVLAVAGGAASTAIMLMAGSASSWLRVIVYSIASFVTGSLAGAVLLSENRIRPYLRSESEAAYSDSKFVAAGAVTAHYLEALPSSGKPAVTLLCLHGFGSACASYRLVLQPLAEALQARVLSVDMPGFGLTSRPERVKDFCPQQMVSHFVDSLGLAESVSQMPLVVVGHSLGGLVAAKHASNATNSISAAVLVAPLVVLSGAEKGVAKGGNVVGGAQRLVTCVVKVCVGVASSFLKFAFQGVVKVLMPVLALVLRRLVYTPDFWPSALGGTYHDRRNLKGEIVAGYRRASWVKGWDAGLLNFVRFRVTAGKSLYEMLQQAYTAGFAVQPAPSTAMVLGAMGKPILFIHGKGDRVIPAANSRFVSALMPEQAEYVEVDACGHCPMEEQPLEFVASVVSFLKRSLSPSVWNHA